jgi:hypothetical protein
MRVAEIHAAALDDAVGTFIEEGLEHWYHVMELKELPKPERDWLRSWLSGEPNEAEWHLYKCVFILALRAGVRLVHDKYYDQVERFDQKDKDFMERYNSLIEDGEAAIRESPELPLEISTRSRRTKKRAQDW